MAKPFTEDDIRRNDLPEDVRGLIHDLCYDHNRFPRHEQYKLRAQKILKSKAENLVKSDLDWLASLLLKHIQMRFTGTLHIKFEKGILSRAWRRHNG
jgi:hypothetical protein